MRLHFMILSLAFLLAACGTGMPSGPSPAISGVGPGATVVSTSAFFGLPVELRSQLARVERFDLDVFAL
jgi:hypothetical protein